MNVNNQEGFPHDNDCCRKQDNRSGQITTSQPCSSPARLWCDDIKKHPNRFFILWGGSYHSVRSSSDIRLSQGNITSNKNNNNKIERERETSLSFRYSEKYGIISCVMAVIKWMCWLFFLAVGSALYVDEPLLYDTFPPGFVWASATSAHQIEGAWNVDGNFVNAHLCPSSALELPAFLQIKRQESEHLGHLHFPAGYCSGRRDWADGM